MRKVTDLAITTNWALTLAEKLKTCPVHSKTAANDAAGPAALPTKMSMTSFPIKCRAGGHFATSRPHRAPTAPAKHSKVTGMHPGASDDAQPI